MRGKQQTTGASWPVGPYDIGLGVIAVLTAVVAIVLTLPPAGPPASGAVLGAVQAQPTEATADPPRIVASPSVPSVPVASPSAPPVMSPAVFVPSMTISEPVIRTWRDSFERSRLQLIVPVRNDGDRWVRLPDGESTYLVMAAGQEVARGALVALPALVGPGETAYLVDTRSVPRVERSRDLVATTDVVALAADPPDSRLVVTNVRFTTGVGGGLLASGTVQSEGAGTTRPVIAGAIALDRKGRPLAALYDAFDIGRLDPGETRAFTTDSQPGGPPIGDEDVAAVVGVAFEAGP